MKGTSVQFGGEEHKPACVIERIQGINLEPETFAANVTVLDMCDVCSILYRTGEEFYVHGTARKLRFMP